MRVLMVGAQGRNRGFTQRVNGVVERFVVDARRRDGDGHDRAEVA